MVDLVKAISSSSKFSPKLPGGASSTYTYIGSKGEKVTVTKVPATTVTTRGGGGGGSGGTSGGGSGGTSGGTTTTGTVSVNVVEPEKEAPAITQEELRKVTLQQRADSSKNYPGVKQVGMGYGGGSSTFVTSPTTSSLIASSGARRGETVVATTYQDSPKTQVTSYQTYEPEMITSPSAQEIRGYAQARPGENIISVTSESQQPGYSQTMIRRETTPSERRFRRLDVTSLNPLIRVPAEIGRAFESKASQNVQGLYISPSVATSYILGKTTRKEVSPSYISRTIGATAENVAFGFQFAPFMATSTSSLNAGYIKQVPLKTEVVKSISTSRQIGTNIFRSNTAYTTKFSKEAGISLQYSKLGKPVQATYQGQAIEVTPVRSGAISIRSPFSNLKLVGNKIVTTSAETGFLVPYKSGFLYKVGRLDTVPTLIGRGYTAEGLLTGIKKSTITSYGVEAAGKQVKDIVYTMGVTKAPGSIVLTKGKIKILPPMESLITQKGGQLTLVRPTVIAPQETITSITPTPLTSVGTSAIGSIKTTNLIKTIPTPIFTLPTATAIGEEVSTIEKTNQLQTLVPRTTGELKEGILTVQDTSQVLQTKQGSRQTLIEVPIQEIKPIEVPSFKYTPITIQQPKPRFPLLPPPEIESPKRPLILFGAREGKQAYTLLVRRGGKFLEVGRGFTLGSGLKKGTEITRGTLAATFRLVPKGKTYKEDKTFIIGEDFELPKPKSRLKAPLTFIQKRGKRLSARSEVSEILKAKRSRSKFFR